MQFRFYIHSMRSSTLKWILLSTTVLIALIVMVQLFWLKKVYSFEEKQFNNNVVKSIRGVFEDLEMNDNPAMNLKQLIDNPGANYFLFKADTIPQKDSLTHYLQREFEDFDVLTDCSLGAYSATAGQVYLCRICALSCFALSRSANKRPAHILQGIRPYPALFSAPQQVYTQGNAISGSSVQ